MKRLLILIALLCSGAAIAQSPPAITKEALKREHVGMCQNPAKVFSTPPSPEKLEYFNRWCACMTAAIDGFPDNKIQQVREDTFDEYAKHKADPTGFVPVKKYSMVRISKSCIPK